MRDWTLLNNTKRHLIDGVRSRWEEMLLDVSLDEADHQRYLEDHAGLFYTFPGTHIVIAKPELGGQYVPDFVVVSDNESYGFRYEFIKLESPHDKAFTRRGTQAVALTHALQQVEDWRRWLAKYQSRAKDLFPSKAHRVWGDPQVSFTVIIGRRSALRENNEIRLQKVTSYKCDIRSFDHLTDKLAKQFFVNKTFCVEFPIPLSDEEDNAVASPFFRAMSSAEWTAFLADGFTEYHSVGWNGASILKHRRLNDDLLSKFDGISQEAPFR